ncbi:type I restriction endonuclease [Acidiphilium acidophilum]|uniref:type I restriction endonuclease subunit R n=1 Tax=Acidiphilium acidophilum TaxID=76588 RepID=UPI002E8E6967|nr:type I restriction endonuclease [Acidiphilium acidophilum]
MTPIHTEAHFESEICTDMAALGWLYTPPTPSDPSPDAKLYDRPSALFLPDLMAWLEVSQPDVIDRARKAHGPSAMGEITRRLRESLNAQGTLHVLRNGFDMLGQRYAIATAQFKPALTMNPDVMAKYQANRLRVIRQVRYSVHNENCIDLVMFLNGMPVATIEVKTDYTQAVDDAEYQYKNDRNPKVAGKNMIEPLLGFPGGALVHFALSNSEVRMTTVLAGLETRFIPFNQGSNGPGVSGGKGNPGNPAGYQTDYLWKEVFAPESWMEILGRFIVAEKDSKKRLSKLVFPRYHQLDSTRKLVRAVLNDGPGDKYLIQHSAGSGKTHSIAWIANFMADLHDGENRKLFDSVIVVSDRTVLDDQLQDALADHERTKGVVAYIRPDRGSKGAALTAALGKDKKIIACTLQTFPALFRKTRELAQTQGKRFVVIADEAHSSQTSETATTMKVILSDKTEAEVADVEESSGEDLINDQIASQMQSKAAGKESGITFIAYTATPKDRTLQLFGTRPDPSRPPSDDNIPGAFHVYSMRQAIEEGFILDVLQNYTPYKLAFQLAHNGQIDTLVDERRATAGIMGWVRLHEYNIAQHVQIVVEHFREHVEPLLNSQAKAMVVTASRLEAVRWQRAMRKYITGKGYRLNTLVAFSGEVIDPEFDPAPVTETSKGLNPLLGRRSIREAFSSEEGKRGEYAVLLVANKFQTGFDEPLLCGMYVHKRLDGIAAVQTLSRLNRSHPGKDATYVVDFINDPDDILKAFKPYYETAELTGVTDPNIIFTLRAKLDAMGYYAEDEVDQVATLVLTGGRQSALDAILRAVADRLLAEYHRAKVVFESDPNGPAGGIAKDRMDALLLFRKDIGTFVRLYGFLCQIFDYGNTAIEKRSIFFKLLARLLTFERHIETVDLSALALTHHMIRGMEKKRLVLSQGEAIKPTQGAGAGSVHDKNKAGLDEILRKVNDLFAGEISEDDKLVYVNDIIKGRLLDCEILIQQAVNNTKEQFANSPDLDSLILDAVMDALSSFSSMSKQALESAKIRLELKEILLGPAKLYEELKEKGRIQAREVVTHSNIGKNVIAID